MDPASHDDDGIAALQARIAELEAVGNDAGAIPLAERLVELASARFGESHPSYAAALATLGGLMRRIGRLEEAEALLRGAIAVYGSLGNPDPLAVARAWGLLTQVLGDAGRDEEAKKDRSAMSAPPADDGIMAAIGGDAPAPPKAADMPGAAAYAPLAQPAAPPADLPAEPPDDALPADLVEPVATGRRPAERAPPAAGARAMPSPQPLAPAPARDLERDRGSGPRRRAEAASPAAGERKAGPILREKVDAGRALEIDSGRLAYQVPQRMWVNQPETVEVRLGRARARGLTEGFGGRGDVRTEDIPIVETMSVSLMCEPGAFDIVPRSEKDQLVKPDLVLGTAFHSDDFGRWMWLVTPLRSGEHTLLVKVSAAIRDSRGLPTTSSLPDRTFAVSVRVRIARAAVSALVRAGPRLAWVVATTIVGILTKDYWWPAIRRLLGWT
jgi:hypothetical protein